MKRIGVLGKTEEFDSEQMKSKLIFFLVQGIYSVIVCLPTKWLYSSYPLSVLYIASIYLWCIWRGGTYYIEVRPSFYQKNYNLISSSDLQWAIQNEVCGYWEGRPWTWTRRDAHISRKLAWKFRKSAERRLVNDIKYLNTKIVNRITHYLIMN